MAPRVQVVVPCYNEAGRLPAEAFIQFAAAHPAFSFLFVDDGSTDNTWEVLQSLAAKNPAAFETLKLPVNQGKAEAVCRGMLQAFKKTTPFVAYWDADLATPLDVLPDFLKAMEGSASIDILLGSRLKLLGRDIQRHMLRHYLGRIFATCASFVLKLDVYDTQCGAKMFRKNDVTRKIFEEKFLCHWIFDVEMLARYLKLKGRDSSGLVEYPLPVWRDVRGSKVSIFDFFRAFADLIRIYIAKLK